MYLPNIKISLQTYICHIIHYVLINKFCYLNVISVWFIDYCELDFESVAVLNVASNLSLFELDFESLTVAK
jgi:hypothetical protein